MTVVVHVDRERTYQRVDGFGFCAAFQRANLLRGAEGLPPQQCREVLDLLFRTDSGAGMSILRLGIGSTTGDGPMGEGQMSCIAPDRPDGPDQPLRYVWDGDDNGQVWLAQQAAGYGVRRFFANPWSAPGYMMENGTDVNGGAVRGMPGTAPADGDWRHAYAEYLLQYVRFYQDCGIAITDLGFTNEPDVLSYVPDLPYAHMRLEPEQVVDFVKVLGRAIERSGMPVSLVSCDAMSWNGAIDYTAAVEADPEAAGCVDIHTGHNYHRQARTPLPTSRPTWMTEWDPDVQSKLGRWNGRWDSGQRCDGIRLAEDVIDAFTTAGISGYLYWLGVSTGHTRALIQADGPDYRVSKRFWAVAAHSRFVRPGAHRVAAWTVGTGDLKVSAFQNADGATVVNLLNLATDPVTVRLDLEIDPSGIHAWLTDETHSLAPAGTPTPTAIAVPARSLMTVVVRS